MQRDDLCEPFPLGMPRGPRLDALPQFVRNLRSRSSPGILDRHPLPSYTSRKRAPRWWEVATWRKAVRELARLLNGMREAGVISDYALFGAAAQMRYTEPVATLDADVLVTVPGPEGLDRLGPIYQFCATKGYHPEGEAIRVGAWPVQFVPVFSPLTREALEQAETADFEGVPFRVVRADHLAVIALSVGRPKDFTRILALLESGSVSREEIAALAQRHGLADAWKRFGARFLDG